MLTAVSRLGGWQRLWVVASVVWFAFATAIGITVDATPLTLIAVWAFPITGAYLAGWAVGWIREGFQQGSSASGRPDAISSERRQTDFPYPSRRFLGSTAALILGVLVFLSSGTQGGKAGESFLTGLVMILGASSYRSAKKRRLGLVGGSPFRLVAEVAGLFAIFALVILQRDLAFSVREHPLGNIIAPVWAFVAYCSAVMPRRRLPYAGSGQDGLATAHSINDSHQSSD